jgi:transposase
MLPAERGRKSRPAKPNRPMVNGILWILRSGAPWRDLPGQYGPWKSVYTRFRRWTRQGVWGRVFGELAQGRRWGGVPHRCNDRSRTPGRTGSPKRGDQSIGRSRGGATTKIHAVVDAIGRPVRLTLTAGQTHEMKAAGGLLAGLYHAYVVGDRAYDAASLREQLQGQDCRVVIPSNPTRRIQRRYDRTIYEQRHHVENFFQRIKQCRRIATRYEKLATTYLAMVSIAAMLTWLA